MPGSSCTICRQRIPRGSRCSRHRLQSPSSRAWHEPGAAKLRQRVLDRDGHACVHCGRTEDLQVHHLIAVAAGGPNDPSNLITVCSRCHRELDKENDATNA